jgi:SAM-dependent methyltransferase
MNNTTPGAEQEGRIRDRYCPAEFDTERYSSDNLSYWTPIMVRVGRIGGGHGVLDVGCATGGFTDSIANATGARLVGCDMSTPMLEYARSNRAGSSVRWVCADASYLPFTPRSFDRAVASLVLHQLPDRERALCQVSRVLTPDGVLLVRTVAPEAASRWIPHTFFPSVARAQANRMPPIRDLVGMLVRAGFVDVATETVVHRKPLALDDAERMFSRELADRYPFVDTDEREQGFARMREHWANRRGVCVDAREVTFLIASKS